MRLSLHVTRERRDTRAATRNYGRGLRNALLLACVRVCVDACVHMRVCTQMCAHATREQHAMRATTSASFRAYICGLRRFSRNSRYLFTICLGCVMLLFCFLIFLNFCFQKLSRNKIKEQKTNTLALENILRHKVLSKIYDCLQKTKNKFYVD